STSAATSLSSPAGYDPRISQESPFLDVSLEVPPVGDRLLRAAMDAPWLRCGRSTMDPQGLRDRALPAPAPRDARDGAPYRRNLY
ncbi:hypothetical protein, partial [Nocardioides hungaricus]